MSSEYMESEKSMHCSHGCVNVKPKSVSRYVEGHICICHKEMYPNKLFNI